MAVVFFSYSHADEALRDRLEKSLKVMERQGLIESFHDRRIPPGDHVDGAISAELERADVILLLVSPDFLSSAYCFDREMERALERQRAGEARIIPIILRPCDWLNTDLKTLMALPPDGLPITKFPDLDDAFLKVTHGIRQALQATGSARQPITKPTKSVETSRPTEGPGPRSSNLHLKKTFTDIDRDRFKDEAFEFIARFFENSLAEIQARNPGVEGTFQRVDARSFTASLYRHGKREASCRVFTGVSFMERSIAFSYGEHMPSGSYNEMLSVDANDDGLFLKGSTAAFYGEGKRNLSFEGASEFLWDMFVERMRR